MSSGVESQKPTSLAEKLAASARQSQQTSINQAGGAQGKALGSRPLQSAGSGNIPARLEEALDVEGDIPINEVEVGGTVSLVAGQRKLGRAIRLRTKYSSSSLCSRSSNTLPTPAAPTLLPTPAPSTLWVSCSD